MTIFTNGKPHNFVPLESNGGVPTNVQDQTTPSFNLYFIKQTAASTLAVATNVNDNALTVADATGFVAGSRIGLFCGETGCFYFANQVGAPVGNVISLDTPIDRIYALASNVISASKDMSSSVGSLESPIIYQLGPIGVGTGLSVDITKIRCRFTSSTEMDDTKFGGISALTNGLVLRHSNSVDVNIFNVKSNGELDNIGDFKYSDRAPAGKYGAKFVYEIAGQENLGVSIRLAPGETLELWIQDDFSGLDLCEFIGQGHFVTD
jgi:hypothetical protein